VILFQQAQRRIAGRVGASILCDWFVMAFSSADAANLPLSPTQAVAVVAPNP